MKEKYEDLANAIVWQAAEDYRKARRAKQRGTNVVMSKRTIKEVEKFFRSRWFGKLTDVPGEALLAKLKAEFET